MKTKFSVYLFEESNKNQEVIQEICMWWLLRMFLVLITMHIENPPCVRCVYIYGVYMYLSLKNGSNLMLQIQSYLFDFSDWSFRHVSTCIFLKVPLLQGFRQSLSFCNPFIGLAQPYGQNWLLGSLWSHCFSLPLFCCSIWGPPDAVLVHCCPRLFCRLYGSLGEEPTLSKTAACEALLFLHFMNISQECWIRAGLDLLHTPSRPYPHPRDQTTTVALFHTTFW